MLFRGEVESAIEKTMICKVITYVLIWNLE